MRILALPVPPALAMAMPAIQDVMPADAPQWVVAFCAGVWTIVWALGRLGLLPGHGKERRTDVFCPQDRAKLDAVHQIVTREDAEKPGWPMVWTAASTSREMRQLLDRVVRLLENQERAVAATVTTLEAIQASLRELHEGQRAMRDEIARAIGGKGAR